MLRNFLCTTVEACNYGMFLTEIMHACFPRVSCMSMIDFPFVLDVLLFVDRLLFLLCVLIRFALKFLHCGFTRMFILYYSACNQFINFLTTLMSNFSVLYDLLGVF